MLTARMDEREWGECRSAGRTQRRQRNAGIGEAVTMTTVTGEG